MAPTLAIENEGFRISLVVFIYRQARSKEEGKLLRRKIKWMHIVRHCLDVDFRWCWLNLFDAKEEAKKRKDKKLGSRHIAADLEWLKGAILLWIYWRENFFFAHKILIRPEHVQHSTLHEIEISYVRIMETLYQDERMRKCANFCNFLIIYMRKIYNHAAWQPTNYPLSRKILYVKTCTFFFIFLMGYWIFFSTLWQPPRLHHSRVSPVCISQTNYKCLGMHPS